MPAEDRKAFKSRVARKVPARPRLTLEALEDRTLPAVGTGLISGLAFVDANGNGLRDSGEAAIRGVTLRLTGATDQGTGVATTCVTDTNGAYKFDNVLPGSYQLSVASAPAVSVGGSTISNFVVAQGQSVSRDFAFRGLAAEAISLQLFLTTTTPDDLPYAKPGSGQSQANYRANSAPVALTPLPDVAVGKNSADTTLDLAGFFSDPDVTNSLLRFNTSSGPVNVELFDKAAPRTVANFLNYVQRGAYDNSIFHRLASGFVLQGGGFVANPNAPGLAAITTDPAVQNEFGASNVKNTLAMAKLDGNPNSATSQFFFNLADNSSNLDKQNGGFTVFGKLVNIVDQLTVSAMASAPVSDFSNGNKSSPFSQVPINGYSGKNFPSDAAFNNFLTISSVDVVRRDEFLTYSVVGNTNPALVTTSVVNNRLTLSYAKEATGTASITVRATDRYGFYVDDTFEVSVANQAPVLSSVKLSPSDLGSKDTTVATVDASDPNGDPVNLTYVWKVDGVVKRTTTTTSKTDSFDLSQPGNGDKGQVVSVEVSASDGLLASNPASVSASSTVVDSVPRINSLVLSPGVVHASDILNVNVDASDADGDSFTLTYEWKVNGTTVQTNPGVTALTSSLDLAGVGAKAGDVITVEVTPSNGGAMSSATTTVAL